MQKCIEVMDKMMKPNQNELDLLKMCSKHSAQTFHAK